jgi:hypothetical protein
MALADVTQLQSTSLATTDTPEQAEVKKTSPLTTKDGATQLGNPEDEVTDIKAYSTVASDHSEIVCLTPSDTD